MPSVLPIVPVGINGFGRIGAPQRRPCFIPQADLLRVTRPSCIPRVPRPLRRPRFAFRCPVLLRRRLTYATAIPVVAINHTAPSLSYLLHSIRYDSTHGTCAHADELSIEDGALYFRDRRIALFSERDPTKIDWQAVGAEYIIESTGKMLTVDLAMQHVASGAKKVVISAPSKDAKTSELFRSGNGAGAYELTLIAVVVGVNQIGRASCRERVS